MTAFLSSWTLHCGSIVNIMSARAPLARLQPFRPTCAQPFDRHQPLSLIDRIEIEDTVEREGVTYYVITVTMRAIPSSTKAILCPQAAPTVYRVERRFREFAAFRQQLTVTVENLHPGYCGYCNRLIRFLSHSLEQPGRLVQLTTGVKQRKRILARFLNQALRIFTTELLGIARRCEGRKIFQSMLRRFLRQHDSPYTLVTSR